MGLYIGGMDRRAFLASMVGFGSFQLLSLPALRELGKIVAPHDVMEEHLV